MLCARCHSELGTAAGAIDRPVAGPRSQDTERNARELLARWSTQHLLEPPIAHGPAATAAPGLLELHSTKSTVDAITGKPQHRFDGAHAAVPTPVISSADSPSGRTAAQDDGRVPARRRKKVPRPHLAPRVHEEPPTPPQAPAHDDLVRMAVQQPLMRHGNWTTSIGQLCAYAGVGVLTLGTVMVLSGYFGGPTNYAPTGWLVAAVGQMLLFLGVVTLVSGGMEQTVDEVSWRIDHLAEQIQHMEQAMIAQQTQLEEARRREARKARSSRRDQADAA